jgi:hypothetical protein
MTSSDGTSTHTFCINAGKDTMTSIDSQDNYQEIVIAQRVPTD